MLELSRSSKLLIEQIEKIVEQDASLEALNILPNAEQPDELFIRAVQELEVGHLAQARLIAWLLYRQKHLDRQALLRFILLMPRTEDLEFIYESSEDEELCALLKALMDTARLIPVKLADALTSFIICAGVVPVEQVAFLNSNLGQLKIVLPQMKEPLQSIIQQFVQTLESSIQEEENSMPAWSKLKEKIDGTIRSWGGMSGITPDALQRWLSGMNPALESSPGLLRCASQEIESLPPANQLLLCLLFRQSVTGTPSEDPWKAVLTELAAEAIYHLHEIMLFPLRVELLEELLSDKSFLFSRSDILFKLASSRITGWPDDLAQLKQAYQELEEAIQEAIQDGDRRAELYASCRLVEASIRLFGKTSENQYQLRVALLEKSLQQALASALPGRFRAMIHDALGQISELEYVQGFPVIQEETIEQLRNALESTETEDPYRLRLMASLAERLVELGTESALDEAEQLMHKALDVYSSENGSLVLIQLHFTLGKILNGKGKEHLREAQSYLEEALRLSLRDQQISVDQISIRLQLGQVFVKLKQPDKARHHFEQSYKEARVIADLPGEVEASICLARVDALSGEPFKATSRLRALERNCEGTSWSGWCTAERLLIEDSSTNEVVTFVGKYLEGELFLHPNAEPIVQQLAYENIVHFSAEMQQQIASWSDSGDAAPCLEARALAESGDIQGACGLLRAYLSETHSSFEHLKAAGLLITLLPVEEVEECLQWCEVVEGLLEQYDLPPIRCDLAVALRMCAQDGDSGLLKKAWKHIEHATATFTEQHLLEHSAKVQVQILTQYLNQTCARSTKEQAEFASWLLSNELLPQGERLERMMSAVVLLLMPGPLVHPDVLKLTRQFLETLWEEHPHESKLLEQVQRWCWFAQLSEEPNIPDEWLELVTSDSLEGLFDDYPLDFLAIVQGRNKLDKETLRPDIVKALILAGRVRPDLKESLVGQLLNVIDKNESVDGPFSSLLLTMVEDSLSWSNDNRNVLLEQLDERLEDGWSFSLVQLQLELLRGDHDSWREGSRYDALSRKFLAEATTEAERGFALYFRGRALMDLWQASREFPTVHGEERFLEEARKLLSEASDLVIQEPLLAKFRFDILVSTGNAFQRGLHTDLDRALNFYEEAEMYLDASSEEGRLRKVRADALLARSNPGDPELALSEINKALALRSDGWIRAETLLSAAQVELALPNKTRLASLRRAVLRLEEALPFCKEVNKNKIAGFLIEFLGEWKYLSPDDDRLQEKINLLREVAPHLADQLSRVEAGVGYTPREHVKQMLELAQHPSMLAYTREVAYLYHHEKLRQGMRASPLHQLFKLLPNDWNDETHEHLDEPEGLRQVVTRLSLPDNPDECSGKLVTRARILSLMVLYGEATHEELIDAANEAEAVLEELPEADKYVKASLLLKLSVVWAPDDATGHPVRDFSYAASLCERAQELAAGHVVLERDALLHLARATRYRTDGDVFLHLKAALEMYETYVERCKREGDAHGLQQGLRNLAELRSYLGTGTTLERRQQALEQMQEAYNIAGANAAPPSVAASFAWDMTRLGISQADKSGLPTLYEAKRIFDGLESSQFSPHEWKWVENNRAVCFSAIARQEGRGDDDMFIWRERMALIDLNREPALWATTAHNLAETMLLNSRQASDMQEALEL